MPAVISVSLTTGDTSTYVYPPDVTAYTVTRDDDILYTLDLAPREPR